MKSVEAHDLTEVDLSDKYRLDDTNRANILSLMFKSDKMPDKLLYHFWRQPESEYYIPITNLSFQEAVLQRRGFAPLLLRLLGT